MLDRELADEVLAAALTRGGAWAEIFVEEKVVTSARLDDARVEELTSGIDRGAGVRVGHGSSFGYAFSNRLDRQALLQAAEAAAASVPEGTDRTEIVDLSVRLPAVLHEASQPANDVAKAAKIEWLKEADEVARSFDDAVRQVTVSYADSEQRVLVATSDGRWVEETRPRIRMAVQVVAERDGMLQTGFYSPGYNGGVEIFDADPVASIAERAAAQAVTMLDSIPAPAGEMPVIMGPGTGGVLFHEACGHGLEADHIHKDASIYKGRLGENLASPLVTGVDDATVQNGWGSFSFDDEGWPSERTVLFADGKLQSYLYDRIRSGEDGVPSTGNGRRESYAHAPIPRMTNSFILAGPEDPEALIAGTPTGVYAKAMGGGQVNPATGDFVFGITEAYLIEDGRLTTPVRGANLVGRGIDILLAVDAVADDFDTWEGTCGKGGQGVPAGVGSPTLRIARMTVGGTGG